MFSVRTSIKMAGNFLKHTNNTITKEFVKCEHKAISKERLKIGIITDETNMDTNGMVGLVRC